MNQNINHSEQHQELMANYAMLKAVMTNSIHALLIGLEDGTMIEVNLAACGMFGYTEAELKTLKQQQLLLQDDQLKRLIAERDQHGAVRGECIGIRKNGDQSCAIFPRSSPPSMENG